MKEKVILLVDDSPNDRLLTIRAFKRHNVANDIVEASDGQEALDYMFGEGVHSGRDVVDQPQLVLLDLKLPKLDGLEVLQRMRAVDHTRYVPVVMLTSSSEQQDILSSYDFGANSYIRKPVDFDQFVETARQLGVYWLVYNEVPDAR